MLKRSFDLTVGSALLVLLCPVMVLILLLLVVSIGRPVFFKQLRPGLGGHPFSLVKFRTMREATDKQGFPLPDRLRITRIGRFLRSTSLDELPELWNVVKGDMSLVGPRPLLREYLPLYSPRQARRHEVRPGVTGWAQIHGRNAISWEEKFELDVWYVENQSFLLDIRILWRTLSQVIRREGINQAGHTTMPRFEGSNGISKSDSDDMEVGVDSCKI